MGEDPDRRRRRGERPEERTLRLAPVPRRPAAGATGLRGLPAGRPAGLQVRRDPGRPWPGTRGADRLGRRRRPSYPRAEPGGRLFPARLQPRQGSPVADGVRPPLCRRDALRSVRRQDPADGQVRPHPGLPTHRRRHLRQPGRAHARPAATLQRRDQRLPGAGPGGAAAGIQPGAPRAAGALGAGGQPVPAPALFLDPERQPGHAVAAPGAGRAPGPGADQRGVRPLSGRAAAGHPRLRQPVPLPARHAGRRQAAGATARFQRRRHRFEQLGRAWNASPCATASRSRWRSAAPATAR